MPNWLELLILAFASMFWPTLILIVVLALRLPQPIKVLIWFLAGGLLTTVSIGIAVVFVLQGQSFVSGGHPPGDPTLNIVVGLLSLTGAFALYHKSPKPPAEPRPESAPAPEEKKPSMAERAVGHGAPVAFAAGIVLNIVPGTFPIIAMKDISQLDTSNGAKAVAVIVFYVIMFAFIEVPIVAYLFAPERTTVVVNDFNAWLGRNGRHLGAYVLGGVGLYLVVRGIVQLI